MLILSEIVNTISMLLVILSAMYISVVDYIYFHRMKYDPFRLIKLGYSVVSLVWAGIYTYLLILPGSFTPLVITRIGVILLFGVWACGTTVRAYQCGIFHPKEN